VQKNKRSKRERESGDKKVISRTKKRKGWTVKQQPIQRGKKTVEKIWGQEGGGGTIDNGKGERFKVAGEDRQDRKGGMRISMSNDNLGKIRGEQMCWAAKKGDLLKKNQKIASAQEGKERKTLRAQPTPNAEFCKYANSRKGSTGGYKRWAKECGSEGEKKKMEAGAIFPRGGPWGRATKARKRSCQVEKKVSADGWRSKGKDKLVNIGKRG